eukprot:m.779333 g.779333  ORF g.779333 m.779333 type:complete len:150 (-) comp23278_c0_seq16:1397-1846(-)
MASSTHPALAFGYLGSAPINDVTVESMTAAIDLLLVKLNKLQKRMIDMLVEKKFGSRLSEASPAYQKYKGKISKKTANLTRGDDVTVSFHSDSITMKDKKSGETVSTFESCKIFVPQGQWSVFVSAPATLVSRSRGFGSCFIILLRHPD